MLKIYILTMIYLFNLYYGFRNNFSDSVKNNKMIIPYIILSGLGVGLTYAIIAGVFIEPISAKYKKTGLYLNRLLVLALFLLFLFAINQSWIELQNPKKQWITEFEVKHLHIDDEGDYHVLLYKDGKSKSLKNLDNYNTSLVKKNILKPKFFEIKKEADQLFYAYEYRIEVPLDYDLEYLADSFLRQ